MTHKEMIKAILNQGYNQKELANILKVSPAQITRWLGSAEPRLVHFLKIQEEYKKLVG